MGIPSTVVVWVGTALMAFLFNLIAVVVPTWTRFSIFNETCSQTSVSIPPGNASCPTSDWMFGLWLICNRSSDHGGFYRCIHFQQSAMPGWFHAIQSLHLVSCLLVLSALLVLLKLFTCKPGNLVKTYKIVIQLLAFAAISQMTTVILFSINDPKYLLADLGLGSPKHVQFYSPWTSAPALPFVASALLLTFTSAVCGIYQTTKTIFENNSRPTVAQEPSDSERTPLVPGLNDSINNS